MSFVLYLLFFISGIAGLIYEVLWLRQLGLLFGASSHASAVTLSVFFAGLAAGSFVFGSRAKRSKNLLKTYAFLELGIFISALFYFATLALFKEIYPYVLSVDGQTWLRMVLKFVLAMLLIFPPSFFMGGTLPVMAGLLVSRREQLGKKVSILYGLNTCGAAIGALCAGFYLPMLFGVNGGYGIALGISMFSAILAYFLSGKIIGRGDVVLEGVDVPEKKLKGEGVPISFMTFMAFYSGFSTLALEVLWTQMFTHVFQNSVYSFTAVVFTTLLCLSLGAGLSHFLIRIKLNPVWCFSVLLLLSGVSVVASPWLFMELSENLTILKGTGDWNQHILGLFKLTFSSLGASLLLLGTLFPYIIKTCEMSADSVAKMVGRLGATNTFGAILGSLMAGFLLLNTFGIWKSVVLLGLLYVVMALIFFFINSKQISMSGRLLWGVVLCATLAIQVTVFWNRSYLDMKIKEGEKVLELWSGSGGTVAVVQSKTNTLIKVNGHYSLGSSLGREKEQAQTAIPLLLHPKAESIYILGLGTGLTASEALKPQYNIKKLLACEINPHVVEASKKYFTEDTKALFNDPRSKVIVDDARHYLSATSETFDIISADLFLTYKRGVGNLLSKEHFENAREHLNEDGLFVQWLPLYQLTEREFLIIAKTASEVFPQVTMWRNQFDPFLDVIALVCQKDQEPLIAMSQII